MLAARDVDGALLAQDPNTSTFLRFSKYVSSKKIKVLNIPDRFTYYQKDLLEILDEKFFP
jgi:predicted protein tyrosine phosphatase